MKKKEIHIASFFGWQAIGLTATVCGALLLLFSSCSNDDLRSPSTGDKEYYGDAIQFMMPENEVASSRTIYGDYALEDGSAYQIYWYDGDAVTVWCDKAVIGKPNTSAGADDAVVSNKSTDFKSVNYTVSHASDYEWHGVMTPENSSAQLLWGGANDAGSALHQFYAVYPKDRCTDFSGGVFTMEYHTNQKGVVDKKTNGKYILEPDMDNAYMMAKNSIDQMNLTDHVLLYFDPIMTTLDITVNAGSYEIGTGIVWPVVVTGVSVIMPKHLKNGVFKWDMSATGDTKDWYTKNDDTGASLNKTGYPWDIYDSSNSVVSGAESVFVNTWESTGVDDNDNLTYNYNIQLFEGESIRLLAFIPPMQIDKGDECYVKVHTNTGYDFIKKVTVLESGLKKRSRITINLPDIYPDGLSGGDVDEVSSKANWMARLDPNLKISQLSIPAVELQSNHTAADVTNWLNQGVRGFDFTNVMETDKDDKRYRVPLTIRTAVNNFTNAHSSEVVIGWIRGDNFRSSYHPEYWDGSGSNVSGNVDCWSMTTDTTLKEVRARTNTNWASLGTFSAWNVIFLNSYYSSGSGYFVGNNLDNKSANRIFPVKTGQTEVDVNNTSWTAYFLKNGYNESIYTKVASCLNQTGCTGIIKLGGQSETSGWSVDYGDLLIQAIIDCNFKFHTPR